MKLITIKHSLLFLIGLLLSFIIAVALGFWKIEKQVDSPPVWPMNFGNITMRAYKTHKIEGVFVHFSVGENNVMDFDFRMPAKEIGTISLPIESSSLYISYDFGKIRSILTCFAKGSRSVCLDFEPDGRFDLVKGLQNYIRIGSEWIAVQEGTQGNMSAQKDDSEYEYVYGEGWITR